MIFKHDGLNAYLKQILIEELKRTKGNRSTTALNLGINRNTLARYIKTLGISKPW